MEGNHVMNLISTSWSCQRCGAAFISTPPEHGLCDQCLADLELLGITISPKQRELFVTEFIPLPPQGLITDRVARNVEEARQALRLIFESKTTEQVAGSAYGLMQAAGEYLDHVRTARSWETRLNRTLIRPEPLKHRALSLIRELAISAT